MPASAASPSPDDFFKMARELGFVSAEAGEALAGEASARQLAPGRIVESKGLLSGLQIDIIETLLRPREIVPGYEILGLLGYGGMGVVYRARQLNLSRVVALKTVLVHQLSDSSALARFEHEARAVARLAHPHIVAAYDFGRHEGRLFFAMELAAGDDLQRFIAREGPLGERLAWQLVRQAAAGLAHAAQQGIVHRDIKPANLLLIEPPAGFPLPAGLPLVKIADFGLARLTAGDEQTRLTRTDTAVGSPHYMPPEQLRGEAVDQRADIFALGATAFHMLAGQPPLAGKTLPQIVAERCGPAEQSLVGAHPSVPRRSAELVTAMMAHDPAERIADYGELIRRIDQILESQAGPPAATQLLPELGNLPTMPVAIEPTRPVGRSRYEPAMRWLTVLCGAMAAMLLVVGLAWRGAPPAKRDLVGSGVIEPLFAGRGIGDWNVVSGGWSAAKNSEGAIVLEGRGMARRRLAASTAEGSGRPPAHYRLSLVVDLHAASAVELQFDRAAPIAPSKTSGSGSSPSDGGSFVVRIDARQCALGQRPSDRAPTQRLAARELSASPGTLHALELERQNANWWVLVDEQVLGTVPFRHAHSAPEFALSVEGGAAWFSDLTLEELVPATGSSASEP